MMDKFYKNIDGIRYGAAIEMQRASATTFAKDEREVLQAHRLLLKRRNVMW